MRLCYCVRQWQLCSTHVHVCREQNRQEEIKTLTSQGTIPVEHEVSKNPELSKDARTCESDMRSPNSRPP